MLQKKTRTHQNKPSKIQNKSLSFEQKKGKAHPTKDDVVSFYLRDDVSTARPGKHNAKNIAKRKCIQKRTLNDYLRNLHTKFHAEFPQHEISLSTFARLRLSYCMLANFTNRHSCLCTKHQNVELKLKMLKRKKIVETENPDAFIHLKTDGQIKAKLDGMSKQWVTYEFCKKAEVEMKKRTGETKVIKKMVLINEEKESDAIALAFLEEISEFREHAKRVSTQCKAQRTLKENLKDGHVAIHLDFAEDFRCRSQEEVQSAYWNTSTVTLHPAVVYFCQAEKVKVKSFVFVSNEIRHDAKFIFALLKKIIPHIKLLVPNAKHCHFFSD